MGWLIFIFEGQANGFPSNIIAPKTCAFDFPGSVMTLLALSWTQFFSFFFFFF